MVFIALMSSGALACGQAGNSPTQSDDALHECPMHKGGSAEDDRNMSDGSTTEHECPMHPQEKSDTEEEIRCPMKAEGKCDMPDCEHGEQDENFKGEDI
jgi:hypothetical protein